MDTVTRTMFETELALLEADRREYQQRLRELSAQSGILLKRMVKDGSAYYYARPAGTSGYKYLGSEDSAEVQLIKEAHHIREVLDDIETDIRLLSDLLNGYLPYDPETIDSRLSPAYRGARPAIHTEYTRTAAKWKAEAEKFKASFPPNYPEENTNRTLDGIYVKSKSELTIANLLVAHNIPYVYELPLMLDYGPPVYPDFTVLSPVDLLRTQIIEHIGQMDHWSYRHDFSDKLGRYIRAGYMPGVNLHLTFEFYHGGLDTYPIRKLIAELKGEMWDRQLDLM